MMAIKHPFCSYSRTIFSKVSFFAILEVRKRVSTTPIDIIQNPFQNITDDMPDDKPQLDTIEIIPTEVEEAKKTLIQKEAVQTGSVSSIIVYYIL
jgi:hypothetical protein